VFRLVQCARKYVGQEIVQAINLASMSDNHLPTAGGLLAQSNWFYQVMVALNNDQAKIDNERMEKWNK